jgi:hypothetical protein
MVKKISFLTFFLLCFVLFVEAQSSDSPRAEFFAGYSVLAANYDVETPVPFMPVITAFDGKQTLKNGFNVSATGYLSKGFGLTDDFSAHFKTNRIPSALGGNIETGIRVFNVTGGSQYKFRSSSRLTPFARVLAGVAVTQSKLTITRNNLSDNSSSTDLALMIGGGLDVRVNKHVDLRVFQADYNPVFLKRGNEQGFGESRADNVRFSFGVVFK